jgi:hypothetical protein
MEVSLSRGPAGGRINGIAPGIPTPCQMAENLVRVWFLRQMANGGLLMLRKACGKLHFRKVDVTAA